MAEINLSKKKSKIKILWISIFTIFICILGIMLFIQFDTPAFASISDNVARPLLGNERVLALEKVFFNSSDNINHLKFSFTKPSAPQFNDVNKPILKKNMLGTFDPTIMAKMTNFLPLDPITSLHYFPNLPDEGTWQQVKFSLFPSSLVAATTFIRPDPERAYATVDILKIDMTNIRMGLVAGTQFPGGPLGNKGLGVVPTEIQQANTLIAAFSGGFQYADGKYGMIVGNKTYVPLRNNIATLVLHKSGKIEILNYTGQDLGNDVVGIRQNCPMLIDNNFVTANTSLGEATWGWTDNQSNMYTIRTGIGITENGNLLFAVGKSLLPKTLGIALKAAGAVNAMQLDINPSWTRFVIFNSLGNGLYTYDSYDKALVNGGNAYLHGWNKDFIYLYKGN